MSNVMDFIREIAERPHDHQLREIFADWLEETGDWRGEFVRLDNKLAQCGLDPKNVELESDDPNLVLLDRWKELRKEIEPGWLIVLSRAPVENCGYQTNFVCPLKWNDLKPTSHGSQRHCDFCNRTVHYCHDIQAARLLIRNDECIAVDLGVARHENDLYLPEDGYMLGAFADEFDF